MSHRTLELKGLSKPGYLTHSFQTRWLGPGRLEQLVFLTQMVRGRKNEAGVPKPYPLKLNVICFNSTGSFTSCFSETLLSRLPTHTHVHVHTHTHMHTLMHPHAHPYPHTRTSTYFYLSYPKKHTYTSYFFSNPPMIVNNCNNYSFII